MIKPVQTYKFLDVIFDPKLKWSVQSDHAARSTEVWINLVRHLARTSTSISAKGMRQLYTAITIPKMTYVANIWYMLPHYPSATSKRQTGSVKFTQKLTSAQCCMTITMLGAMRSTAGDVLNTHAFLPPPHPLFLKSLIRSTTQLVILPNSHPSSNPHNKL